MPWYNLIGAVGCHFWSLCANHWHITPTECQQWNCPNGSYNIDHDRCWKWIVLCSLYVSLLFQNCWLSTAKHNIQQASNKIKKVNGRQWYSTKVAQINKISHESSKQGGVTDKHSWRKGGKQKNGDQSSLKEDPIVTKKNSWILQPAHQGLSWIKMLKREM